MTRTDTYARDIRSRFDWVAVYEEACHDGHTLLGSVFTLTPSGKFYAPFACSNVMGCARCKGTGSAKNRKGDALAHEVAKAADWAYRSAVMAEHGAWSSGQGPEATVARLRELEKVALAVQPERTCSWCGGCGSHEAAKDQDWFAALERVTSQKGLFVGGPDGADGCDVWIGNPQSPVFDEGEE